MAFNFGFLTTLSVVSASGVDLGFVDELRCFTCLTSLGASAVVVFVVVFFTLGVEAVGWFSPLGQPVHRKGKVGPRLTDRSGRLRLDRCCRRHVTVDLGSGGSG